MAESGTNYQYIQNYSRQFASIVSDGYFKDKTSISGKDILGITGVKQVNLLVIRNIYHSWQCEIENIKSPYFSYSTPEVMEALAHFGNILSNHILISRTDFEPLLAKGVEQALLLILSPYEFFINLFNSYKNDLLSLADFRKEKKYLKVNTLLYDSFLRKMDEGKTESCPRNSIIEIFNQVCEKSSETPDEPDELINILSKTIPFDLKQAYRNRDTAPAGAEKHRTTHDVISSSIASDKKTLLDEYQDTKTTTIAEFLQHKTIDSIRKSITINQKFMFVRELFKENEESFTKTINELDDLENFRDAEKYIDEHFFKNGSWQRDTEAVNEFLEVLQKKFA